MKRINTMVSDEAKGILVDYKETYEHRTLDEALDALLIEFRQELS